MANTFSRQLIKARSAAGFDSAYKFYHRNGGRRHFKFTFVHYNRIERGLSLPRPEALPYIFLGLRLLPTEAGVRELLLAYIRSYLGGGQAADYILNPVLSPAQQPADGDGPMGWMKAHSSVHLSPREFSAMAESETAYWCAEALCNDPAAWYPEELAAKLELQPKAVKTALESLKKAGLALKTAAGKYKCRYQGKFFTYPGRLEGMGGALDAVKGYWAKAAAIAAQDRAVPSAGGKAPVENADTAFATIKDYYDLGYMAAESDVEGTWEGRIFMRDPQGYLEPQLIKISFTKKTIPSELGPLFQEDRAEIYVQFPYYEALLERRVISDPKAGLSFQFQWEGLKTVNFRKMFRGNEPVLLLKSDCYAGDTYGYFMRKKPADKQAYTGAPARPALPLGTRPLPYSRRRLDRL